jgi:large subunit ribosomal protein L19
MRTLDFVDKQNQRRDLPPFKVGDTVSVHVKVREGDKERIQIFQGLVTRRRGNGAGETFTVRKVSSGVGVERIFPVQSPLVTKLEIRARGFVRRSRLYYLRDLSGKKARLHSKVRDLSGLISEEEGEAIANASNLEEAAPLQETAAETHAKAEAEDGDLKGKARKKANAEEKAKRKVVLEAEAKERAERKAREEAAAARAAEAAKAAEAAEAAKAAETPSE